MMSACLGTLLGNYQSLQKTWKRSCAISVYLTVC